MDVPTAADIATNAREVVALTSNMPAIRLMTWNIDQLCGQMQSAPRSTGTEVGVLKVVAAFLAQDERPAIVALQEVPSEGGCGYKPDPSLSNT